MRPDVAASVRARLLALARAQQADFNQVLVRYALERLLYRLSVSDHAERFVLKGALLFTLWYDMPHRATRDADLLGFGAGDKQSLAQTFREVAGVACEDGMVFDAASIRVDAIRKEASYAGVHVTMRSALAGARCRMQIDVGFGDAVTPGPVDAVYPVLLDNLPAPRLRTYPVYTVIAEKLHAIALLGMTNSRMKDYLDLSVLFQRERVETATLADAIVATFTRRGMALPAGWPLGLSDEFATDGSRQTLWRAFLGKHGLPFESLSSVVFALRSALEPALEQARLVVAEHAPGTPPCSS